MKNPFVTLAFLACLLGFVGCQKENELPAGKDYNTIITVKSDAAKTHYNPSTHGVEWDSDDQISVIRGNSGDGNDFSAFELVSVSNGEARFGGNISEGAPQGAAYFAIYPAQEGLSIEGGRLACEAIQPHQALTINSFGMGNNTAVGYNASTTMCFRNVGGLAKIAVRGTAKVKSIKVTNTSATGDKTLSGRGTIDLMKGELPIEWAEADTYDYVEASAASDAGFDVNDPKFFYLVLPPCTMSSYTVTITDIGGNEHSQDFTTPVTISRATVTMLGAFAVNDEVFLFSVSRGKQVQFAPGNLVYNGAYSFAEHQYDYGSNFCWGTGGNPTETFHGPSYYQSFDDWGNYIDGGWRTLTKDEWIYVINDRTDASSKRGAATVCGVHGMVLLPDDWIGLPFDFDNWEANVYDAASWAEMEASGAVFLPAAGYRMASEVEFVGDYGCYWSSTPYDDPLNAYQFEFHGNSRTVESHLRYEGLSVRLVKDNE